MSATFTPNGNQNPKINKETTDRSDEVVTSSTSLRPDSYKKTFGDIGSRTVVLTK